MTILEKEYHSGILAWEIPWTEGPGVLWSMGFQRVIHDLAIKLEKEMATHSSILAWRIPWKEEPGGLLPIGSNRVRLDWSDLAGIHALEKEMATHSSILAWRIPGTEEPGRLPSMGSHRVGQDWSDLAAAAGGYLGGPVVRLWASNGGGLGSIPGQGTRSYIQQLKKDPHMPEWKDPACHI